MRIRTACQPYFTLYNLQDSLSIQRVICLTSPIGSTYLYKYFTERSKPNQSRLNNSDPLLINENDLEHAS